MRRPSTARPSFRWIAAALLAMPLAAAPATQVVDLDGRRVDPFSAGGARAVALVFLRADCPISNRYAPEIERLREAMAPRGVAFWLVFPDPEATSASIRAHIEEHRLRAPALRDPAHELVALAKATVTPEAAVFRPDGSLAYRGRIDDRYASLGRARPAPTVHDLEEALESVLDGRAVKTPQTTAIGCGIAELR